jgi:predicted esterase
MKWFRFSQLKRLVWITIFITAIGATSPVLAQVDTNSQAITRFTVQTYDGLELPAQVLRASNPKNKMLLFINGSTPYDEQGNQWAGWDDAGKLIKFNHDFYCRFLDIMSSKGYDIATMAKRSFVYSHKIPRPNLDELALDIQSLVLDLKKRELLRNAHELIIVGYSEGSIVATKVLGLLKKQPAACVLLGSASNAFNFRTQTWEKWHMTEVIRKSKSWSDEQLRKEFEEFGTVMTGLLTIDEDTFENEWKKNKSFGFGFAPWESYHIDRECQFYNPVPNLLTADTPVLICIGENDTAMPMVLARRTYEELQSSGYQKASFRVIEGEVHSYKKYDVFAIIDTWLDSGGKTTDFVLGQADKAIIGKYALVDEVKNSLSALSWEGGQPDKALACFGKAKEANLLDPKLWFDLGVKLFAHEHYEESLYSFTHATDPGFILCFASMVWLGHLNDLSGNRDEALSWYKKGLDHNPGFPIQHDQWGIKIDKKWIEDRLISPFKGV